MSGNRRTRNPELAAARRRRRSKLRHVGVGLLWVARKTALPAVLVGLFFGAKLGLGQLSMFSVQQVAVRNNHHATAEEILLLSDLSSKDNLFRLSCAEVAEQVEQHPWVSRAAVYRRFPAAVVIEVSEHRPVLAANLAGDDGTLYLVSEQGEIFKKAELEEAAQLPILSGLTLEDVGQDAARADKGIAEALSFLSVTREIGNAADGYELAEIEVMGDGTELSVLLAGPDRGTVQVRLGEAPFVEKWRRLARLWRDLDSRGVLPAQIEFVSETKAVVAPAKTLEAKI